MVTVNRLEECGIRERTNWDSGKVCKTKQSNITFTVLIQPGHHHEFKSAPIYFRRCYVYVHASMRICIHTFN